jgi:hypothetical protein
MAVRKLSIVGTISGPYCGALDGTLARLLSRTEFGNIVELLEAKGVFNKGAKVCVEDQEFHPLGEESKNPKRRPVAIPLIEDSETIDALRAKYIDDWARTTFIDSSR